MNPELPPNPRAELEAQVTAWLLGELSADEAARVRELLAHDPELARLRDRLSQTLNLLREMVATPMPEATAQPAPLKLSAAKREKLLAHFKTIAPVEFAKPPRRKFSWVMAAAAVAALVVLAGMLLPALSKAKIRAQYSMGVNNWPMSVAPATSSSSATRAPVALPPIPNESASEGAGKTVASSGKIELPQMGQKLVGGNASQQQVDVDRLGVHVTYDTGVHQIEGKTSLEVSNGRVASQSKFYAYETPAPVLTGTNLTLGGEFKLEQAKEPVATARSEEHTGLIASYRFSDFGFGLGGGAVKNTPSPLTLKTERSATASAQEHTGLPTDRITEIFNGPATKSMPASPPASLNVEKSAAATLNTDGSVEKSFYASSPPLAQAEPVSQTPATLHGAERMMNRKLGAPAFVGSPQDGPNKSAPGGASTATFAFNAGKQDGFNLDVPVASPASPPASAGIPIQYAAADDISGALSNLSATSNNFENATNGVLLYAFRNGEAGQLKDKKAAKEDEPLSQPPRPALVPQAEVLTSSNAFTTFSLNISDVAYKLAQASLQNGVMPEAASMRSEEFINAFDYRDPEPAPGAPLGFAWERAGDPFAHNRDFLRFAIKTAAQGREVNRPLNLVLLLDKSGSMERADRVEIIARALGVLAAQLHPQDTLSVVVFARTPRLFVEGIPGNQAGTVAKDLRRLTPEGGTNLEEAMRLAYATAMRHYLANGENRVVLLTDGAANLGNVDPAALKQMSESNRKQGITLDCFGVGWDGYNDTLLESLSRAGNGRYGFVNTPQEADTEFAGKLAGALRVAAADVKVQVEFNPNRVTSYRQIGYAKDQLKKEDFRDNSVKAAQVGVAESGNALYTVEINPAGDGPVCTVHVRYRVPGTDDYQEHEWTVPYTGSPVPLDKAGAAMRLAAVAAEFSEWLAGSPYAAEVTPDKLLSLLNGVPQIYGADVRPKNLEWMIRQAKSISGK